MKTGIDISMREVCRRVRDAAWTKLGKIPARLLFRRRSTMSCGNCNSLYKVWHRQELGSDDKNLRIIISSLSHNSA